MEKDKYYCYIIRSINPKYSNHTYNGSTNNLTRRLRQHNGIIVGGAKSTKNKGPWEYLAIWEGFDNKKEALSCEWKIKHPTNTIKRPTKFNGVKGRIKSLNLLLNLNTWTNQNGGMGTNPNQYILYVDSNYIELINQIVKKENLIIKNLNWIEWNGNRNQNENPNPNLNPNGNESEINFDKIVNL